MRIGIVSYDFDPPIGGLGVVAAQVKQTLQKLFLGDTYLVLSPSEKADERVGSIAASRWRKAGGCPLFSLMLFFRLPALIQKHRLNLLHVHSGSGGVFLLQKPSCSLVVTAHHTYLQEAEIVFADSFFKSLWKRMMSVLERRTYRLADRIACVSGDTADFLVNRYGIPEAKVIVIENAVRGIAEHSEVSKDPSTILFIGRLEERKGIWTLLKAAVILRLSHPDIRVRLIGQNLIGEPLQKFLVKNNLTDIVTVLGHVHDPFMQRELTTATLLVVPSLLEGFGLVAADALIAGTCVVASDAPGLRSILSDHKTGLLFKTGDAVDCARVIAHALDDSQLRIRLAEQGRHDAIKRFSFDERAKDLHRIFLQATQK